MYAVIQTGGKQYKVEKNMVIEVELLEATEDSLYEFSNVILISDASGDVSIGQPFLEGAKVSAEVLKHDRDKKIVVFKYKRKTGYSRKTGHRQALTRLKIKEIMYNNQNLDNQKTEEEVVTSGS